MYGKTALAVACRFTNSKSRFAVVRELLGGGASATVADKAGALALHEAAWKGHTDVFALLLSAAPTTISVCNWQGLSALGCATLNDHTEAVSFLLSAGASDKAIWLEKGLSPLNMAVQRGDETMIRMFLDRKGIDAAGGLGVIPRAMFNALQFNNIKALQMPFNVEGEQKQKDWANAAVNSVTMLHSATMHRSFAGLQMLLSAGLISTPKP